jgi:hypothetical protein
MDRRGSNRFILILAAVALLFAFTPLSTGLLRLTNGSFSPARYSALALRAPSDAVNGILAGEPVAVRLTNHTGSDKRYHWSALEDGALLSIGVETVSNGRTATIYVPSSGAKDGTLRIELNGTNVFVTVPVLGA